MESAIGVRSQGVRRAWLYRGHKRQVCPAPLDTINRSEQALSEAHGLAFNYKLCL